MQEVYKLMEIEQCWVKEEIKNEIKDFLEFNKNECTIYPHLWDTMKAVLREKFIVISTYIKKVEKSK